MRRRHRLFLAAAVGAALLALPALASADCGDQILTQATQQGAVTGKYPLRCYDLALSKIDPDLEEYGEAPGIIRAAKAARREELNAQDEPRNNQGVTAPDEQPSTTGGGSQPAEGGAGPSEGSGDEAGPSTADGPDTDAASTDESATDEAPADSGDAATVAAPTAFDGGGGDGGLPVPVMILGGLAVVLIGVGAGGMLYRRLQS